jgi:large subunit ribosomal protein L32
MTPLPKRKHSKGRTHRRRSHDALSAVKIIECSSCHKIHLSHRVCPSCGNYAGEKAIEVKAQE